MIKNPYKKFSEDIETLKDRISKREALETVIEYNKAEDRLPKKRQYYIDLTEPEHWN